jgi:histidinol phosphatase-like PHP family hydrolase
MILVTQGGDMVLIDFHTHAKLSKKAPFSLDSFATLIDAARGHGLDAIALTEHFNTSRFYDMYQTLDATYPYLYDYYDVAGFRVFSGMEVDVVEGGHILCVARRDALIHMRRKLDGHELEDQFVTFDALLSIARDHETLVIGAHPMRVSNPLTRISEGQLAQLDALDLNGKDLNTYGVQDMSTQVEEFAIKLVKPVVMGSDTHHPLQIGCVSNEFRTDCRSVAELRREINGGNYRRIISAELDHMVQAATAEKQRLKAALGV